MVELNWTEEAQEWLRRIYNHIAGENEAAAASVIQGIYEKAQHLTRFPEMGYIYSSKQRNVRILLYGHYRIAYLVRSDQNIDDLGVFHGALKIRSHFNIDEI